MAPVSICDWKIFGGVDCQGEPLHSGVSNSEQDAFDEAEFWIDAQSPSAANSPPPLGDGRGATA